MDAAPDRKAGVLGERHVGADAHGHDEQVAGQRGAVVEFERRHAAVFPEDLLRVRLKADGDALFLERLLEQVARGLVELALHQVAHDVHHGDLGAACGHAGGRLEPEKTAADDHDALARAHAHHAMRVLEIAVGDHPVEVMPRERDHERHRAGADHELVVGDRAVLAVHHLRVAVDAADLLAEAAGHAGRLVEGGVMGDDLFVGLLARENRRQHDAVVVAARLGVEERDLVGIGRGFRQVLDHAAGCHAGADDDQFLFHVLHSAARAWGFGFGVAPARGLAPCSYSSRKSSTSCR